MSMRECVGICIFPLNETFCRCLLVHVHVTIYFQFGIIGFTKMLAIDESKNGVRVNW